MVRPYGRVESSAIPATGRAQCRPGDFYGSTMFNDRPPSQGRATRFWTANDTPRSIGGGIGGPGGREAGRGTLSHAYFMQIRDIHVISKTPAAPQGRAAPDAAVGRWR